MEEKNYTMTPSLGEGVIQVPANDIPALGEAKRILIDEVKMSDEDNELNAQHQEHERQKVKLVMQTILKAIVNREQEMATIKAAAGNKCQKQLKQMVEDEVLRCADGVLWCPDYSQRPHSDQLINCYVGSHWMKVPSCQWKDFVNDCAERCGLPIELRKDENYMEGLYKGTSFRIFKYVEAADSGDEILLNFPNCTLQIGSDGSIVKREHRREDLFFYCLPYDYDEFAECPLWLKFLDEMLPDPKAQQMLGEYICYILMRSHRLEVMLWLYGTGGNGKSTVLRTLFALLGAENVSEISLEHLTQDLIMRAEFEHKLLNCSSEAGDKINSSALKQIVSGEAVPVMLKYENPRYITDYGKLIVSTNTMPKPEQTDAFFRRTIILPFLTTIPSDKKDTKLAEKLKAELAGILNWALGFMSGLLERNAITSCESSEQAVEEYRLSTDSVKAFLQEKLEESDKYTEGKFIFDEYKKYCGEACLTALQRNTFYSRMNDLTKLGDKKNGRTWQFRLKIVES